MEPGSGSGIAVLTRFFFWPPRTGSLGGSQKCWL